MLPTPRTPGGGTMPRPLALVGLALTLMISAPRAETGSLIRTVYQVPKTAQAQEIYREMRALRVLEGVREIVSMVRLPRPINLRLCECDGESNAWYEPKTRSVTVG